MIVAQFVFGPFDGKRLILPCEPDNPWPKFVIPRWDDPLFLEVFYLRSGQLDDSPPMWAYLLDDTYSSVTSPS